MSFTCLIKGSGDTIIYLNGLQVLSIKNNESVVNVNKAILINEELLIIFLYCNIKLIEGELVNIIIEKYNTIAKKIKIAERIVDENWKQTKTNYITNISKFNGVVEPRNPIVDLHIDLDVALSTLEQTIPKRSDAYNKQLKEDLRVLDLKIQEYIIEQEKIEISNNEKISNGHYLYEHFLGLLDPWMYGGGDRMVKPRHPFYSTLHYGLRAKAILGLEKDKLDEYINTVVMIEINIEEKIIKQEMISRKYQAEIGELNKKLNIILGVDNEPAVPKYSRFNRG